MFDQQLIVVSGKGGVGKTVMASAIAVICARRRRTMLASFDPHLDRHPIFDVPLGYEPAEAAPNLSVMRVEALPAIREYVRRKLPFSGLYDTFLRSRMFRDFAGAAPGFEELMCLGKLYDLVTDGGYERVVFDAPSTGHLRTLVDVPAATLKAVLVGPLNHNARKIQDLLMNPDRTRVVVASLPEEMAVREALELESFCQDRRMRVGPVIVNQRVSDRFAADEIAALSDVLVGFPEPSEALRAAIDSAAAEHDLAASQAEAVAPLSGRRTVWTVSRCIDHEPPALLAAVVAELEVEHGNG
ncbi:MAG: ArsA family ATPase [Pseudomonadales bacterium]